MSEKTSSRSKMVMIKSFFCPPFLRKCFLPFFFSPLLFCVAVRDFEVRDKALGGNDSPFLFFGLLSFLLIGRTTLKRGRSCHP